VAEAPACSFRLGFKALRDRIPEVVGRCLEDERFDPGGGAEQRTSGGLLVWRQEGNVTAFADGGLTWVLGPRGQQRRPSAGPAFAWEGPRADLAGRRADHDLLRGGRAHLAARPHRPGHRGAVRRAGGRPGRLRRLGRRRLRQPVVLDHGDGLQTAYAHLSEIDVAPGQPVKRAERPGLVGSTGYSSGPHLRFEVRRDGAPRDPLGYLAAVTD
jgi:hypothetical protein